MTHRVSTAPPPPPSLTPRLPNWCATPLLTSNPRGRPQACAALDFVVVEDAQSAQACVELLRSQRLGVATFLILDKQRHLEADMRRGAQGGTPEGVPRLFDLVRVADDRLRVAFFFAMRDTVVADDLDQATRIAYGEGGQGARAAGARVAAQDTRVVQIWS